MSMSKKIIILLLMVLISHGLAFPNAVIFGKITDSTTNRPLAYVNVYLPQSPIGCVSDSNGHFELKNLPAGRHLIIFQRIGYKRVQKYITLKKSHVTQLNIQMLSKIVNSENIIVEDTRWKSPFSDFFQGEYQLTRAQIKNQPGAFEDPLRSLHIITGIINQSDYTSNIYIRGSKPNEQAVILDGVLLQNPYRLRMAGYGGISIINPDIVDFLRISLGGFPANYGQRSGGLVEINTVDGTKKWTNLLALNLVSTRYLLSGPIRRNLRFIFSTRKTYYDFLLKKLTASQTNYPFFTDAFAKLVLQASPKLTIKIATLFGREGSNILNNKFFNGRIFSRSSNFIVYANIYGFLSEHFNYRITIARQSNMDSLNASSSMVNYYRNYDIRTSRLSLNSQIEWELNRWFSLSAGGNWFSAQKKWYQVFPQTSYRYRGRSFYFNNHIAILKKLRLKTGLRFDYSTINRQITYDPRFSLSWKISPVLNLGFASGIYHKFPQKIELDNHDAPVIPDSLLSNFRSPFLQYFGLKLELNLFENLAIRCEGYYKKGFRLQSWHYNKFGQNIINDNGKELAQGIEINVKYTSVQWKTRLGYSFSKALNKGRGNPDWQYKEFDVRHWLNWFFSYSINRNFKINSSIQASSGFPVNEPIGWYKDGDKSWDLIPYSVLKRYPYFRWDIRFIYHKKHWSTYIEIINLTNRKNFYQEMSSVISYNKQTFLRSYVTYMLPRLPILGVSFEF